MLDSADFRVPSMRDRVSAEEWQARLDLAAAYRLVALHEMSDLSANHISARAPGEEAFLISPYGMLCEEITASSLIKIDHAGDVLPKPDFPGEGYGVNRAGFVIHSAIHKARHEAACVAHTHTWAGMAVSVLDCGFLPITSLSCASPPPPTTTTRAWCWTGTCRNRWCATSATTAPWSSATTAC